MYITCHCDPLYMWNNKDILLGRMVKVRSCRDDGHCSVGYFRKMKPLFPPRCKEYPFLPRCFPFFPSFFLVFSSSSYSFIVFFLYFLSSLFFLFSFPFFPFLLLLILFFSFSFPPFSCSFFHLLSSTFSFPLLLISSSTFRVQTVTTKYTLCRETNLRIPFFVLKNGDSRFLMQIRH